MCSEEQDVLLPVNPDASISLLAARADSFACVKLFDVALAGIFRLASMSGIDRSVFRCAQFDSGVHLGTFFGRWKQEAKHIEITCRQAAFYALGIQSQRRVLGLQDRYVYGLIQTKGFLHLVVSYWEGSLMVCLFTMMILAFSHLYRR